MRVVLRLVIALCWLVASYLASLVGSLLFIFSPKDARRARMRVSRVWFHGMRAIIGMRILRIGDTPKPPYFLVSNHHTWEDLFAIVCMSNASFVLQAEDADYPVITRLLACTDPIYYKQTPEDAPRVTELMCNAIRAGKSLVMAPENIVSPGHMVREFHSDALEAAVVMQKPVHYVSITYRTPDGWPPPSKSVIFGPDPYSRTPDGKFPDSEIEAWGHPPQPFLPHLLRLLALPWHEAVMRFGPEPILGTDRVSLANDLHVAVLAIFTPSK
jgi:1-acyl-sn-glycerol-3-phosphate acyltransferase